MPSKPPKPAVSAASPASEDGPLSADPPAVQWLENEALIEWAVARLAAACNEVATATASSAARREALRFKAAFATSGYSIMSGRNPLVQVLDFVATAGLLHQVWIVEGRAASEFGTLAPPIEQALLDIRERARTHALTRMSANELRAVEEMVRTWREAHPRAGVVEFIRFEAFADEYTRQLGKTPDLGGMFGRIAGGALSLEVLGERALILLSRMPRLAEWHAEAAAANILARPDLTEALSAVRQLGEMQRVLPQALKALDALDSRLAALPAALAGAVGQQPELQEALAQVEQTGRKLNALEATVASLEKSVDALSAQLAQVNSSIQPAALQPLADGAVSALTRQARSLVLLATGCAAAIVVLHALLRRWGNPPSRPE